MDCSKGLTYPSNPINKEFTQVPIEPIDYPVEPLQTYQLCDSQIPCLQIPDM